MQETFIVVLPYSETARFFHASKTIEQEAFIGENDSIVYYQFQAKKYSKSEAANKAQAHLNTRAFVRPL